MCVCFGLDLDCSVTKLWPDEGSVHWHAYLVHVLTRCGLRPETEHALISVVCFITIVYGIKNRPYFFLHKLKLNLIVTWHGIILSNCPEPGTHTEKKRERERDWRSNWFFFLLMHAGHVTNLHVHTYSLAFCLLESSLSCQCRNSSGYTVFSRY